MKKLTLLAFLFAILTSLQQDNKFFSGKIHYVYSFTNLQGYDITSKAGSIFGLELDYYSDEKNYKSFDENHNRKQLYNSATNTYYHFTTQQTAQKIDGSKLTSKKIIVTKLEEKENILGYECQSLRIETDNAITDYFYSPAIRTNPANFSKHQLGEWNKYLEASGGALPLKYILTDYVSGVVWTATAVSIENMEFSPADFEFPVEVELEK